MAGKRLSEQQQKKKRKSKPSEESKLSVEDEEESPPALNSSLLGTKNSASSSADASHGDALQVMKTKFNELHALRFTDAERQCTELIKLAEEKRVADDALIKKLQARIVTLDEQMKSVQELKRRERELLQQVVDGKAEEEKLKKALEIADQERTSMLKALESSASAPSSAVERLVTILDAFKLFTGVTLKFEEGNTSKGTCTVYNALTKKGVKFEIVVSDESVDFKPVANKQFLPAELRDRSTVNRDGIPKFLAKVIQSLFL